MDRTWIVVAVIATAAGAWAMLPVSGQDGQPPKPADPPKPKKLFSAFDEFYEKRAGGERIEPGIGEGENAEPLPYYAAAAKALKMPDGKFPGDLDSLLRWFGCRQKAQDLEDADPDTLNQAGNGIQSVRFFSPKTTDVSARPEGEQQQLSWRKLVRVHAAEGSEAAKNGITDLWWLGNIYTTNVKNPFGEESQNNQVILVPKEPVTLTRVVNGKQKNPETHTLLFAVHGPKSKGYPLAFSTTTSWDAMKEPRLREYFVPTACIQCHGKFSGNLRLNLLDTDYYQWRHEDHEDFPAFGGDGDTMALSALPDFGRQTTFEAFRDLNREMHSQNQRVDGLQKKKISFQTDALSDWFKKHPEDLKTVSPAERMSNPPEGVTKADVTLLVRYCYRCHGTISYSVLDGDGVRENKDSMEAYLDAGDMPQDRVLDEPTRDKLKAVLKKFE